MNEQKPKGAMPASINSIYSIVEQLTCPISYHVMVDPVIIETGHTFDRPVIERWFQRGNLTNPLTNATLTSTRLVPNICVRNLIDKLPKIQREVQHEINNLEELLVALQKMWNGQTPNGVKAIKEQSQKLVIENQSLKEDLKLQCEQKLIQKLEWEVQVEKMQEKLADLEKKNLNLRFLLKKQTDLNTSKQQELLGIKMELETFKVKVKFLEKKDVLVASSKHQSQQKELMKSKKERRSASVKSQNIKLDPMKEFLRKLGKKK